MLDEGLCRGRETVDNAGVKAGCFGVAECNPEEYQIQTDLLLNGSSGYRSTKQITEEVDEEKPGDER